MTNLTFVGERWGAEEERERTALVGSSGYLFTKMCEEAGINRADCFLTNVLNFRPANDKIEAVCGDKKESIPGYPALLKGKYLRREFAGELERLGDELLEVNPNLIVALGNIALWALCGRGAVSKARGTTLLSTHTVEGFKVLPTYNPAAISRQWELRPITVIDLQKALRESEFPEIRRPKREIWIEPGLADLEVFYERYIRTRSIEARNPLSVDIETAGTHVTCIGFGYPDVAIVIPFFDQRKKGRSYWDTQANERAAWDFNRRVLEDERINKLFHNGMYDVAFLWRSYGVKTVGAEEDTLLLHHALQPESLKGLAFLGSIYCDEGDWKQMRQRSTTIKQED